MIGATPGTGTARREPDVLDIGDVTGRRVIETGYRWTRACKP